MMVVFSGIKRKPRHSNSLAFTDLRIEETMAETLVEATVKVHPFRRLTLIWTDKIAGFGARISPGRLR
jgi:hypothetical protein